MEAKYKILVVEDDELIRSIYTERLNREIDFDVHVAVDGLDGINKVKETQYDLIFSGIQMPNKTGFDLFEFLQSKDKLKNIPFIIFSHLGRSEDIQQAYGLGIKHVIVRGNTTPNDVVEKIKDILHQYHLDAKDRDNPHSILIIEDDKDLRDVYVERFQQQENFIIDSAIDGLDGFNKAKNHQYDLVFSGIQMPNMTGFEVFEKLKLLPGYQKVPIVLFSHLGRTEDIETAKKLGVRYFIIRGQNSPNDILNKIRDILHSKDKDYTLLLKKDSPDYSEFIDSFFGKDCIEFQDKDYIPIKLTLNNYEEPYTFTVELNCKNKQ